MAEDRGWFSSTGSDNSHLTDGQRRIVEERVRSRGPLLGVVQVRVYEHWCEPFVTFPEGAVFGAETDQLAIAEMVERAPCAAGRLALGDRPGPGNLSHLRIGKVG